MKAIFLLFDTLNRRYLPPYGCDWVHAPNFARLAERTAVFDNCYAGSMPCIPARRELNTGRYNFLHRGWGPLEPFDDSVPELLRAHGVYTHLVTDHQHYWEDGGATYHNRFNSYELFRGQEGDPWKGQVADPDLPEDIKRIRRPSYGQDWVNRQFLQSEELHPQTQTVDAGLEFIRTNYAENHWFLQLECFDPHEPFFTYDHYRSLYPDDYDGPHFDWPDYKQVLESREQAEHLRLQYASLLSMCDQSLGRVLDLMDELGLWEDTLLMVGTDHGLLLGEHRWWGKNVPPWYDETIHTPLFVWDPRSGVRGQRRVSLVQTIDFGPTLLDWFGVQPTSDMQGRTLKGVVARDEPVREAALFGAFGGHVSVTDGRYVYMRACATPDNTPLYEFTLMPTHMKARFAPEELRDADLVPPFGFTKDVPLLRVPGFAYSNPYAFGTLLFDLHTDLGQTTPLLDEELELRMARLLIELMRANDAPAEQFDRLGLPVTGPVTIEHLLAARQYEQAVASQEWIDPGAYARSPRSVHSTVEELVADPRAREFLRQHAPALVDGSMRMAVGHLSLVEVAAFAVGVIPKAKLDTLAAALERLSDDGPPGVEPQSLVPEGSAPA
jgi:arylsulfatase A-like enzyme